MLTHRNNNGTWGLEGVMLSRLLTGEALGQEEGHAVFAALERLRDYEATGLNPDGVTELLGILGEKKETRQAPEKHEAGSGCDQCAALEESKKVIEHLSGENNTLMMIMEFLIATTQLWAMKNGLLPGVAKEDFDKKFADGKKEVSALFDKLVKTGQASLVNVLLGALNIPEDFQHFI